MSPFFLVPLTAALAGLGCSESRAQPPRQAGPESRALAYLGQEVQRWSGENKCYSCHNNGDGARALYTAIRLSYPVPPATLAETSRWLAGPPRWDHNGGASPFSDKKLARIQFAAALVDALSAGQMTDRQALLRAAALVVEGQEKDGSWQVDAPGSIGSPATYGACLATCQARRILHTADPVRYQTAIARADHWFCTVPVKSVVDAAAALLALKTSQDPGGPAKQRQCLVLIQKAEAATGGWGPYTRTPPEVFDTALALLAISHYAEPDSARVPIVPPPASQSPVWQRRDIGERGGERNGAGQADDATWAGLSFIRTAA